MSKFSSYFVSWFSCVDFSSCVSFISPLLIKLIGAFPFSFLKIIFSFLNKDEFQLLPRGQVYLVLLFKMPETAISLLSIKNFSSSYQRGYHNFCTLFFEVSDPVYHFVCIMLRHINSQNQSRLVETTSHFFSTELKITWKHL